MVKKLLEDLMTRATRAYSLQDYATAERYAKEVMAKATYAASPHILLGMVFGSRNDYRKAIAEFNRALELRPGNIEALNNLGVMYRFIGEHKKAEQVLLDAKKNHGDRADISYNLGNVYKQQNRLADAVAAYTQAIELNPELMMAYNNLGTLYEQQGDFHSALEIYNKGLDVDPNHPMILYNRGVVLQHLGNYTDAEKDFEGALSLKSGWVDALNNLGIIRQHLEKYEESEKAFAEILSVDPGNVRAKNNLATTYARQGRQDEAIELYKSALENSPEYERAAVNLGHLLEHSDQGDRAVEELEQLYKRNPENGDIAYHYAQVLRKQGNVSAARSVIDPFTRSGNQSPEMDRLMGIISLLEDKRAEAQEYFERARKQGSNQPYKQNVLNEKPVGPAQAEAMAWNEGGEYERAIEILRSHLQTQPDDIEAALYLGSILMDQRKNEDALSHLEDLNARVPGEARVLSKLARLYQQMGLRAEALQTADELISLQGKRANPDDLTSLNQSLELYEQAVSAYQDEHGAAWDRSLSALGQFGSSAELESDGLNMDNPQGIDEDTVPVLDFGDTQSLIDEEFLIVEEGLVENEEEEEPETEPEPEKDVLAQLGAPGSSGSSPTTSSPSPTPLGESRSTEPELPESFMNMVDEPKVSRNSEEDLQEPQQYPTEHYPTQPERHPQGPPPPQPNTNGFPPQPPSYPQSRPGMPPQFAPYPQAQPQMPSQSPVPPPYYPPTPPSPVQPPVQDHPNPEPPKPPVQDYPNPEPPKPPVQEYPNPQPPRAPAQEYQNPEPFQRPPQDWVNPREPAEQPAPPEPGLMKPRDFENHGDEVEDSPPNLNPEEDGIHLQDDFLESEPESEYDGELKPEEEVITDGDLEPLDFSRFDEEPELQPEGDASEEANLSDSDEAVEHQTNDDLLATSDEEADGVLSEETQSDLAGGDSANQPADYPEEQPQNSPEYSQAAPVKQIKSSQAHSKGNQPDRRRSASTPSSVDPQRQIGLFDYLLKLTDDLPEPVKAEFSSSGTKDRLSKVKKSLADNLSASSHTSPAPAAPTGSSVGSVEPTRPRITSVSREPGKAPQAGVGKAFGLLTEMAAILPREESEPIRARLRAIYHRMEEIRGRA